MAINSVNHQTNSDYYINNIRRDDANTCGLDYQESPYFELIEYDGFTAVLEAKLDLIPCETYHIRLVVADVGDNFYDSAVFLEAGSFNLGGEVALSVEADDPSQPYIVEEGCQKGYFVFERANQDNNMEPLTVKFNVSDASTAQEGIDFDSLPDIITIPGGVNSVRLPVTIINDLKTEPLEFLTLELDIPCACYTGLADLIIKDSPALSLDLDNQTVCTGDDLEITPQISGGTAPFSYIWEDGAEEDIRLVSPTDNQQFSLTITDACGNKASDNMVVGVKVPPSATIMGDEEVCEGDTARLRIDFDGLPPFSFSFNRNNNIENTMNGILSNPFFLPVTEAGRYTLGKFSDAACAGNMSGEGMVQTLGFEASWEATPTSCYNGSDGEISVRLEGGKSPFRFDWEEANLAEDNPQNLAAGTYAFTVTDADGCSKNYSAEVLAPPPIEPISFECEDLRRGIIRINTTGGAPPYLYSIDGASFFNDQIFQSLVQGNNYDLWIQDSNGCLQQQAFTMPVPFNQIVELPSVLTMDFGIMNTLTPQLNIPAHLVKSVSWTPFNNLSCSDCLQPEIQPLEDRIYTIRVEDQFGCQGTASTTINVKTKVKAFIPSAFSPNNDNQNDQLTIYANEWQISSVIDFQVFDRWGNLLYKNQNFPPNQPAFGWDGKINGQRSPNGIYVVIAKVKLVNDQIEIIRGQSLLMK